MDAILEKRIISQEIAESAIQIPYRPLEKNRLESAFNRFLKRTIDIIFGGGLAIILLPVIVPVVAILIKLESKGPVFFVQKRTGLNRKSFYCIKFRSMVVNKEANRIQVRPGDTRITKVGNFLRKFYIDELPQLINVIRGDMSLVGPRPHMLRHNVMYSKVIGNYHDRHSVKPGMTGLAQMRGYHGMIHSNRDLYNRISSDLEYIEKWTWFGDLHIFYRTLVHIVKSI